MVREPDGLQPSTSKRLQRRLTPGAFISSRVPRRFVDADPAGASAYLTKPDDLFEIVQTVNSILSGKAARGSTNGVEKP